MAKQKKKYIRSRGKKSSGGSASVDIYEHKGSKRLNNPQVGLVNTKTEKVETRKTYKFDPHLDPQLQWAGKEEKAGFELPTVSLHVHERVDPRTIIEAVKKSPEKIWEQMSLFNRPVNKLKFIKEIEFYQHEKDWTNRIIAGDSLLVMNSLLEKEGMAGKIQMVYFDPPYGIKYGSNFQPFVNKKNVKDGSDEDLNQEPEMVKAFRDTWELGIHSYLTHIRERLLLSRALLSDSGSCFLQIGEENVHFIKSIMAEIFGASNFVSLIYFKTTGGFGTQRLSRIGDYLVWFAKDIKQLRYNQLFYEKTVFEGSDEAYKYLELIDGTTKTMTKEQKIGRDPLPESAEIFRLGDMCGQGASKDPTPFKFLGKSFSPSKNNHWKPSYPKGLERLAYAGRIKATGKTLNYVRYLKDKMVTEINNAWMDTGTAGFASDKKYVVETNTKVIERCILMATNPGDLVLDITCGSGTSAYCSEKWGRRWITVDTSRVALTLAKQRIMTGVYDYYKLQNAEEGVSSGFEYKSVPYVKMSNISNNAEIDSIVERYSKDLIKHLDKINKALNKKWSILDVPDELNEKWSKSVLSAWKSFMAVRRTMRMEIKESTKRCAEKIYLLDNPLVDQKKIRIAGPFTYEAVPSPIVSTPKLGGEELPITSNVNDWVLELLKTGIRLSNKKVLKLAHLEPMQGTRWLHAEGMTKETPSQKVVVSFGSDFSPLEQRQVELALQEAEKIKPSPTIIVFAAFQFDPEAAKDIDEIEWGGVSVLKVLMNADLFTDDLKKKRSSNESFWLVGQPDVEIRKINDEESKKKFSVLVKGFDYYNTKSGAIESGGSDKIAMWMLDSDYDGRSLLPRQVFFPMAGKSDGWAKLAKSLKAELDEDLIVNYGGTESLPFEAGTNKKIAVKIIDDRGIESLVVRDIER